nr:peptidylprolyl isomerase [Acidobacteriota bacterium]
QLKSGADFATLARARSEETTAKEGGDIGFFSEEDLRKTGFPQNLIQQFFGQMKVGDITQPVKIRGGWYIFKLTQRSLQPEVLTLDSPGVRSQIMDALIKQRKQLAQQNLLEASQNQAKIVNYLAADTKPQ